MSGTISPPAAANETVPAPGPPIDVLIATSNSAATLERTLESVRRCLQVGRIIVVDRKSTDGTATIAERYGAEVHLEDVGLGRARNLALELAGTDPVLFVDSDVEIVSKGFYPAALAAYHRPQTAAVVGMSVGHPFQYGLPLGLTLIGRRWATAAGIPDAVQGRETYFLQRAARKQGLRVRYIPNAMRHFGTYRQLAAWPEFQGAAIRVASGWNAREVLYAFLVVLLMHANSRRPRNVLYTPVFWLKLVRGFLAPDRWARIDRRTVRLNP